MSSTEQEPLDTEIVEEEKKQDARDLNATIESTTQSLELTKGVDLRAPATAITAQLIASIQARYIMAERHPRDLVKVKESLLRWCDSAKFAEEARYKKPMGGGRPAIEGFSVRFVETAIREMGNIFSGDFVVHEDEQKRIVKMAMTDLERNVYDDHDMLVPRTVERRFPRDGQKIISKRINSAGKEVFLVEASDDELEVKVAAMRSKAYRTLGLKFVPPDIKEECERRIKQTMAEYAKRQPDEARKRIIEAFAAKSISERDLAEYLGHPMDRVTGEEILDLRAVYLGIHDGEFSWRDVMEAVRGVVQGETPTPASKLEEVKEAIRSKRSAAGA